MYTSSHMAYCWAADRRAYSKHLTCSAILLTQVISTKMPETTFKMICSFDMKLHVRVRKLPKLGTSSYKLQSRKKTSLSYSKNGIICTEQSKPWEPVISNSLRGICVCLWPTPSGGTTICANWISSKCSLVCLHIANSPNNPHTESLTVNY